MEREGENSKTGHLLIITRRIDTTRRKVEVTVRDLVPIRPPSLRPQVIWCALTFKFMTLTDTWYALVDKVYDPKKIC